MTKTRLLLFILSLTVWGCKKDTEEQLPAKPLVEFKVPAGFPQPVYSFANNPVNDDKFILGRKLFYDPILSVDNSISCESCHQQFVAFAHSGHMLSHGVNNQNGTRNSPGIFNLAWQTDFFWDGGTHSLEQQPLGPITNPVEMGETLSNVIQKLSASPEYPSLFKKAFGDDTIDSNHISKALAMFMSMLVSDHSRYDEYRLQGTGFSDQEKRGYNLFRQKCTSCHQEPLLTDNTFRNNGLESTFSKDPGRAKITLLPQDSGKFKVPSLRNVLLTTPYMHDGRFPTLMLVLDHYSTGIKQSLTLDPLLVNKIPLTYDEKLDLIAFLGTLTDIQFINDNRFAKHE